MQVVLLPVSLSLLANAKVPKTSKTISQYPPFPSVLLVALMYGIISVSNASTITTLPIGRLLGAIITLHSGGFIYEYIFAEAAKAHEPRARTISIEEGMQNSVLAAALASHFPSPMLTALPVVFQLQ